MTDTQEDFALLAIFVVLITTFTLLYHKEIWVFLDWCMTVTENFHRRQ
jgi:hypothetical protein